MNSWRKFVDLPILMFSEYLLSYLLIWIRVDEVFYLNADSGIIHFTNGITNGQSNAWLFINVLVRFMKWEQLIILQIFIILLVWVCVYVLIVKRSTFQNMWISFLSRIIFNDNSKKIYNRYIENYSNVYVIPSIWYALILFGTHLCTLLSLENNMVNI